MISVPNHIAIIMDGNRRWADKMLFPYKLGHQKGANVAKKIAIAAKKIGVKYLTLYAFSSENWQRPKGEVDDLMDLLKKYLSKNTKDLIKHEMKIKFIGARDVLDDAIVDLMDDIESQSMHYDFTLSIAISYGARDEIKEAAKKYAKESFNGSFDSFLYTAGTPDPDLLIRSGGDMRLSNFLLWQIAYTELIFSPKLWPDFSERDLSDAVEEYSKRKRKFGG